VCTHIKGCLKLKDGVIQIMYEMLCKKLGKIIKMLKRLVEHIQTPTPGLEHDKIWAWWASNVPLESMLERVWWCKLCKMELWNWAICYPMTCLNGRKHAQVGGGRRSHDALKCYWKRNVLLSTCVKASRRKGCWSTINLAAMTEMTRAQLLK
jgi:hypothetical protein